MLRDNNIWMAERDPEDEVRRSPGWSGVSTLSSCRATPTTCIVDTQPEHPSNDQAESVRRASAAESKAFATASRSSGSRRPYLSSFRTADLWPRSKRRPSIVRQPQDRDTMKKRKGKRRNLPTIKPTRWEGRLRRRDRRPLHLDKRSPGASARTARAIQSSSQTGPRMADLQPVRQRHPSPRHGREPRGSTHLGCGAAHRPHCVRGAGESGRGARVGRGVPIRGAVTLAW